MTEKTLTLTAIISFAAGGMVIAMWLGSRLARVTTDRNRLQAVVDGLREQIGDEREMADRHDELMADKIAQLTRDSMEFQRLAHDAQDGLDMAKDMLSSEIAAHKATKRQLAAAKGQITKLKRRIEDAKHLNPEDVQWIVNSIAELGVLINGQAFFLYKGSSLVYENNKSEDGIMMYRPVFKREFGECCHPINYAEPTKIGTVSISDSDEWRPLPEPPK